MLAGAHKRSERVQYTEIYLLGLKVQYKDKTKLPLDMVSKHVLLSVQRPDYRWGGKFEAIRTQTFHATNHATKTNDYAIYLNWQYLQNCKDHEKRGKKHRFHVYKNIFIRITALKRHSKNLENFWFIFWKKYSLYARASTSISRVYVRHLPISS